MDDSTLRRLATYDREQFRYTYGWLFRWLAAAYIVFFVLAVWGCCTLADSVNWFTLRAFDAGRPTEVQVSAGERNPGSVSGISLRVTGQIDGEVEIWADNWEPQRLSGTVDWEIYHDWFKPTCRLHCRPVGNATANCG